MTNTRASSLVPLLVLLFQCGTRIEQPVGRGAATGGSVGSGALGGAGGVARGGNGAGMSGPFGTAGFTSAQGGTGSGVGAGGTGVMLAAGGVGAGVAGGGGTGGVTVFTIASTAVPTNGTFTDANTCLGADTSPDLEWPPGISDAQSYAISLADAATGVPQWIVWDIPATVTSLPAGVGASPMLVTPAGAKQVSSSGAGYVGPCPMGSQHFYEFTIYALPVPTLAGVTTDSPLTAVATAINLSPPIDVSFFGASAGMNIGGAAGTTSNGGVAGTIAGNP